MVGSADAMELMRKIPISAVDSIHGIGPASVDGLRRAGYRSAADLWDERRRHPVWVRVDNVAEIRGGLIENWASQKHSACVTKAASNVQRRERLTAQVASLREQIERPPDDGRLRELRT